MREIITTNNIHCKIIEKRGDTLYIKKLNIIEILFYKIIGRLKTISPFGPFKIYK
jgi:hypothetical protein